MIEMDYRNVSCGGDPFNFLMASIKSIEIDINEFDTAKVMLIRDKYRYDDKMFEKIVNCCKLKLINIERTGNEIHLILRK